MEISDNKIKQKHKEFNDRVKAAVSGMSGGMSGGMGQGAPGGLADKIRQALARHKPTMGLK